MSEKAQIEVALTVVLGISLVFLLPTVQLLPATTRAWRWARTLLPLVRRLARAATKLSAGVLTALLATPAKDSALIPSDIVSLGCARLC